MLRHTTVVLLAAAVLAPAAGAWRYTPAPASPIAAASRPTATCHQYCRAGLTGRNAGTPARPAVVRTELVSGSNGGFHWLDAAVGFGFAVLSAAIVLLSLSAIGGRRTRARPASSAS